MKIDEILEELSLHGWTLIDADSCTNIDELIFDLGTLINKSDIKTKDGSNQFIHGSGYVEFHTDDPRARYVVWKCIETADFGGENILKDMRSVYEKASPELQANLQKISFIVDLPGAPVEVDFVSFFNSNPHFYYAPWKKGTKHLVIRPETIFLLSLALQRQDEIIVTMKQGDVLVIDNKRMVHGRRPYQGVQRHLVRYLISSK